jgi:predicted DNA-binding transcriptional regulator YafY
LLILAILEILRRHTDADHRLRQSDIIDRLESEYELTATRKSVRANLTELQAAGYPIEYSGGWYYDHEFCEAELNLLVDSLLYNPNIPYRPGRELIEKIRGLGGEHYRPMHAISANRPANPQFLYTLDTLHEALDKGRRVTFQYGLYDVDKQIHVRMDGNAPKVYDVSPYRIVLSNGRYYLICNVSGHDVITHFRLDRIVEIRPSEYPAKDPSRVRGLEDGLNLPEYLAGHAHMFTGEVKPVRLRADRTAVPDILDWFGMDTRFENVTDETVEAIIRTDELSLKYWLKMFGEYAGRI